MQAGSDKQRCIFCEAAASSTADDTNLVIHRGSLCFIILNRYPYTSGHLMIAPYEHVSRLSAAHESTSEEMMRLERRAEEILQAVYNPDGLNLGMNLGEAAGAGIEQHIHLHVLPRWRGDANFMSIVGHTRIIPEALEDTYAKLKGRFVSPDAPEFANRHP
ncbi:MAG: HIT family protein [Bryobacteraceae bacterium]|jgi:ATP adenylyltransferase